MVSWLLVWCCSGRFVGLRIWVEIWCSLLIFLVSFVVLVMVLCLLWLGGRWCIMDLCVR